MKTSDYLKTLAKALPNIEFATDHGRIYDGFVRSLMHEGPDIEVLHPSDYKGQKTVKLVLSQHPTYDIFEDISAFDPAEHEKLQRRYTEEWIGFLKTNKLPLNEVNVCSSVNQSTFDALCTQESIESLRIKRFTGKNIAAIGGLKNLKKLFIESASSVTDISPLAILGDLEVLILGQTKKVCDYSVLAALKKLKVLGICAYRTSCDTVIRVKDLEFIKDMPSLEYVDFSDVRSAADPAG